jgi:hypothetical protein
MFIIMVGISLFINMIMMGDIYSALMFVIIYILPTSIYMNFNREMSLKEKFLERRENGNNSKC